MRCPASCFASPISLTRHVTSHFGAHVQRVAQAIAQEVDGEDGQDEEEPREGRPPPVPGAEVVLRVGARILPQLASGILTTPAPRKSIAASTTINAAIFRVVATMSGRNALGSRCRKMMRPLPTPTARAASVNS